MVVCRQRSISNKIKKNDDYLGFLKENASFSLKMIQFPKK